MFDLAVVYLAVAIVQRFKFNYCDSSMVPLIAPALAAALYLAVVLRFLLPLPTSSPNLGGGR